MGAGKLPEQITDRAEAGRRAMVEDQIRDPIIERLMAMPVIRKIEPERKSRPREVSAGALMGEATIAKRMAIARQLKTVLLKIDVLRASDPKTRAQPTNEQISVLRQYAKRLRKMLPPPSPQRKRSKKRRVKPRQS